MRRPAALPRWLQHGIARAERERKANIIARPMRNLMDMLKQGEVYEIDGRAVMRMPEIDEQLAARAEWVEIAPAIEGWRDCWQRLAPDISTYHLGVLAARLRDDKPITPRLVRLQVGRRMHGGQSVGHAKLPGRVHDLHGLRQAVRPADCGRSLP